VKPSDSGDASLGTCAWVACGAARTVSVQRTAATVSGRRAGSLRIATLHLGVEGRQRRAHELPDLPVCRDPTQIERGRDLRHPRCQELMHLADVLDL
jgi:hypothetical protein